MGRAGICDQTYLGSIPVRIHFDLCLKSSCEPGGSREYPAGASRLPAFPSPAVCFRGAARRLRKFGLTQWFEVRYLDRYKIE